MKEHHLRVLVIESDPDRVQLFEEAFSEMEELWFSRPSYPACTREYALDWRDGLHFLELPGTPPPDAILLNITRDCAPSAPAAFTALRAAAPSAAVIAVAARQDEPAALGLIRMGAEDYLVETEIDCGPLGRSLRCAVERSRLNWSRQSLSMVDDLTGLYNHRGVAVLAERDERLAESLHLHRWSVEMLLDKEPSSDADLHRLELAEQLNELMAAGMVAGRQGEDGFVVFGLAPTPDSAAASAGQVANRLESRCRSRSIPVNLRATAGNATRLCENR